MYNNILKANTQIYQYEVDLISMDYTTPIAVVLADKKLLGLALAITSGQSWAYIAGTARKDKLVIN